MKSIFRLVAIVAFVGCGLVAEAQQPAKVWSIGVLVSSSQSQNAARDEGLRQGLRELGYVEGKNIIMEFRYAEGKLDRLPELAAELVRSKVDVIVVGGTRVATAAKQATGTIPIVVAGAGDLVKAGLIRSYTRPETNVTGVSRLSPDFTGKRLNLLREAIPKLTRVAALSNPDNPGEGPSLKDIELGARSLAMTLQSVPARSPKDLDKAFATAAKERAQALLVMTDAMFNSHLSRLAELAAKNRLPAMYDRSEFAEAGGLMSYGVNLADLSQRAAWYVDQIFKGSKPADLPLVEPVKYELVINLQAAKKIGLAIPQEMVARADKVIK
jgi:putative ABC transport system substrate-binding protein